MGGAAAAFFPGNSELGGLQLDGLRGTVNRFWAQDGSTEAYRVLPGPTGLVKLCLECVWNVPHVA